MSERQFVKTLEDRGFKVKCQNGEDLIILNDNEEVARVSAFHPFKMSTFNAPSSILELIVDFSLAKYENRHV